MVWTERRPWAPGRRPVLEGLDRVVGHRGAARRAPENTLAGLARAHELGCRWVEFDVKLSADGVPFLLHDDTLDRTTTGRGPAARADMAHLATLDAGSWFGRSFRGERPPTLAQALRFLLDRDMRANVEIKPCPGREAETARRTVEVLREHWPEDRPPPLLSSFARASLAAARDAAADIPRGLLVERVPSDWQAAMTGLACVSLHPGDRYLDEATLRMLVAEAVPLLVYTVNDPARARQLLGRGVEAVISDVPDLLLAALGQ